MENLTYQAYLADPAVRVLIEREVRQGRAEAVNRYIVSPPMRLIGRAFSGTARVLQQNPRLRSA